MRPPNFFLCSSRWFLACLNYGTTWESDDSLELPALPCVCIRMHTQTYTQYFAHNFWVSVFKAVLDASGSLLVVKMQGSWATPDLLNQKFWWWSPGIRNFILQYTKIGPILPLRVCLSSVDLIFPSQPLNVATGVQTLGGVLVLIHRKRQLSSSEALSLRSSRDGQWGEVTYFQV